MESTQPRSRIQTALLRLSTVRDEEYFFENLSMLLASGIDIGMALASLEKSVRTKSMKSIVHSLAADIDAGLPLSKAIERQQLLPGQMIQLIRIGEQSGRLGENLKVIVGQLQKNKILKSKVFSAMAYPLFVFGFTVIIGIGIAWFILPNLSLVFVRLNVKLPLTTQILIAVGTFLGTYGAVAIPATIALLIILVILFLTVTPFKMLGQTLILIVPGVQTVIQEVELTRFGFIVGTLLDAGLPFPQALDLLSESTGLYRYKKFYRTMRDHVEEGNPLAKSIDSYRGNARLVPIPFQQLIAASESSGKLAPTLIHIGELSEAKTDLATKNLSVMLEPVLLIIVWLGVLWVAISVILPIYSLIGGLNSVTGP